MSEAIQVQIDDRGDIVIPAEIRERLGLVKGMTFIAEDGEQGQLHLRAQQELPQVIEEDGVLIVTSPLSPEVESPELSPRSLTDAVREHREQRLTSLWPNSEQ
jgi:AbrB family looped-hinge helix DNA binding protein